MVIVKYDTKKTIQRLCEDIKAVDLSPLNNQQNITCSHLITSLTSSQKYNTFTKSYIYSSE